MRCAYCSREATRFTELRYYAPPACASHEGDAEDVIAEVCDVRGNGGSVSFAHEADVTRAYNEAVLRDAGLSTPTGWVLWGE